MNKAIHNISTDEITVVELSDAEVAQLEKDVSDNAKIKQDRQAKEAKKQEVLTKLGLTAEEAQALLGQNNLYR